MTTLLTCYGFELEAESMEQWVQTWLSDYSVIWVRLAIIEALYQGRYKAISVQQILNAWQRRGEPIYHFDGEFECIVSRSVPRNLLLDDAPEASSTIDRWVTGDSNLRQRLQKLRPALTQRPPTSPQAAPTNPGPVHSEPMQANQALSPTTPDKQGDRALPVLSTHGESKNLERVELGRTELEHRDLERAKADAAPKTDEVPTSDVTAVTDGSLSSSVEQSEQSEQSERSHFNASDPSAETNDSITPQSEDPLDTQLPDSTTPPNEAKRAIAPHPDFGSFVPIHSIHSIQQFTPSTRNTGFYARLRAVVAGDSPLL
jgi:hypothetical protein